MQYKGADRQISYLIFYSSEVSNSIHIYISLFLEYKLRHLTTRPRLAPKEVFHSLQQGDFVALRDTETPFPWRKEGAGWVAPAWVYCATVLKQGKSWDGSPTAG